MKDNKNEIVLFENQDVKLEVNVQDETVWLNLEQMAELFKRDKIEEKAANFLYLIVKQSAKTMKNVDKILKHIYT